MSGFGSMDLAIAYEDHVMVFSRHRERAGEFTVDLPLSSLSSAAALRGCGLRQPRSEGDDLDPNGSSTALPCG